MVISKCPLRISLVGGSTDLQEFIDRYDRGSVVSFPANLYTYIMMDYSKDKNYTVHYSKFEKVTDPSTIKNDIAREVILYFDLPPVTISFNADIPSTGSGLAASTSYILSMIKCIDVLLELKLSQYEICKIGLEIERKFNPLCGYQDAYGCGLPSLKRLDFYKDKVTFTPLYGGLFREYHMHLFNTYSYRSSTNILSTIDVQKCYPLLQQVDLFENNINDIGIITYSLMEAWKIKKQSSELISNEKLMKMEEEIRTIPGVLAYKLLGAGGGGYFFVLADHKMPASNNSVLNIDIDDNGVVGWKI